MNDLIEFIKLDPVLSTIFIVLICVSLLYISYVFRQSSVISFLLAGILVGPYGINLLPQALASNTHLGELAIAFLLFVVGLELDFSVISWKEKHRIAMGAYQVVICAILLSLFFLLFHFGFFNSLRLGLLCAMSSTAVVLKVLEERKDSHSPYALNATTILIVQDLFAVLLMAVMALPGDLSDSKKLIDALINAGEIALFVPTLYVSARYLLPKILKKINKKAQPELFMLALLIMVLGASSLGHYVCDSPGMGAFIAGFALASSPMAFQIRADIDPFKQVLLSIFFLTIGASFNVYIFQTHWMLILVLLFCVPIIKTAGTLFSMVLAKLDFISSFRTSMAISQVGEFSLLLAVIANKSGWLNSDYMQVLFALIIASMGLTPFLIKIAHSSRLKNVLIKFIKAEGLQNDKCDLPTQAVIIGYGIAGQKCAEVLEQMGVRYSIIDQNAKTIETLKSKNIKAIFGDASRHEILHAAGIEKATWLIVAVPTANDRLTITCEACLMNPSLDVIVRSHFIKEKAFLEEVGAHYVISEEEAVSGALSDILKDCLTIHKHH